MIRFGIFLLVIGTMTAQWMLQSDPLRRIQTQTEYARSFDYQMSTTKPVSPSLTFLKSAVIPGWGQYDLDQSRSWVYLALEVALISTAVYYENEGDRRTQIVNDFANDSQSGFDRIRYYKNIYEAVNGSGSADPGIFDLSADEATQFKRLKSENGGQLYQQLKSWEKNTVGDGVHSLPDTRTQQYYEMIGKYRMFYHGWNGLSDQNLTADGWRDISEIPAFIDRYYDKRNSMNDAFEAAGYAVSAVILNHVVSSLDALISARARVKMNAAKTDRGTQLGLRVEVDL